VKRTVSLLCGCGFARRMFRSGGVILAWLLLLLPAAAAGESLYRPYEPKILLHLTHPTTKGILCDRGTLTDCTQAVVNGDLYPNGKSYFLFVEVGRGDSMPSLGGVQLGIDYDPAPGSGVDVFTWTYCGDMHYASTAGPHGGWPAPLSGNTITWNVRSNCQTSPVAVAGYFYMAAYSPDVFHVIPRPADRMALVADCQAVESMPLALRSLGRVAFSSGAATPGCNPCVENCTTTSPRGNPIKPQEVPTVPVTWGAIKMLYHFDP
jgi:hypothetical protein